MEDVVHADWTERHRPSSEEQLVGNNPARRRISTWLQSWEHGRPSRRGILLIGPPGVGKTTIARAIAHDRGWDVIELNASDARNAAAIRRAATQGATHQSLFNIGKESSKTLILIDEVDHIQGGLVVMPEERIGRMLGGDEESGSIIQSGDRGGKAELLRLLSETRNPVMLACNDEMGLWGRGSNWLETRSRFRKVVEEVHFKRARQEELRDIARRVMRAEGLTIDPEALDALVKENPGDIRALVRDMQAVATGAGSHLHLRAVRSHMANSRRDQHLGDFPGLSSLYRCRDAVSAREMSHNLDQSPDALANWVSWNNSSLFTSRREVSMGARALAMADNALPVRFHNLAYRSWYWGGQLSLLAAVCPQSTRLESPRVSYPNFLRRGNEIWRRGSIMEKLATTCGASRRTVQRELLPILSAMYAPEHPASDPKDFRISQSLGLTASEHAMVCGLPASRNSTKDLIRKYEDSTTQVEEEPRPLPVEKDVEEVVEEVDKDPGQTTLF